MTIEASKCCIACGKPMSIGLHPNCKYCDACSAPVIYRFVCPDDRSYVGSTSYPRDRNLRGLERSNSWLLEAFEKYPPETWSFEVLEKLPYGCSREEMFDAEQRHIERLGSWMKELGFNIYPAVWEGSTPAILAGRARNGALSEAEKIARLTEKTRCGETFPVELNRFATAKFCSSKCYGLASRKNKPQSSASAYSKSRAPPRLTKPDKATKHPSGQ